MQNSKRLLFVVTQAEWGGVQSYVLRAALEARQRGFDVLVTAGGAGELETRCLKNGIPYRRLLRLRRDLSPLHDIAAIRELKTLMREWRPRVVYLHSSKAGVVGGLAARFARRKEDGAGLPRVIYRIGGWSFLDPVPPLQRLMRLWSERLTARLKDVIITVHPGDEELARRRGIKPRERVVTIPNGLDLDDFDAKLLPRDEARALLRALWRDGVPSHAALDENAPLMLTVANFYPTKNLLGYLDSVKLLISQRPGVRALVLGGGEERRALENKRRALGLENIVSLPGKHDDAAALLAGADLFVLPSLKEGMPWTVLEAMAAGLPCIVTDVGANRWMLEDAGTVAPRGDAKALADAILRTFSDHERARELGLRGRTIVERRFTEGAMWEATFAVLE